METAPKIGQRVRYLGKENHVGPCTGTVIRVYPNDVWDEDLDWSDDDLEPGVNVFPIGRDHERNWQVAFKCDERPSPWPYGGDLLFAPSVSEIHPIRQKRAKAA